MTAEDILQECIDTIDKLLDANFDIRTEEEWIDIYEGRQKLFIGKMKMENKKPQHELHAQVYELGEEMKKIKNDVNKLLEDIK